MAFYRIGQSVGIVAEDGVRAALRCIYPNLSHAHNMGFAYDIASNSTDSIHRLLISDFEFFRKFYVCSEGYSNEIFSFYCVAAYTAYSESSPLLFNKIIVDALSFVPSGSIVFFGDDIQRDHAEFRSCDINSVNKIEKRYGADFVQVENISPSDIIFAPSGVDFWDFGRASDPLFKPGFVEELVEAFGPVFDEIEKVA